LSDAKFQVFSAVKIQVEVFWFVMPCRIAEGYKPLEGPRCLHLKLKMEATRSSETFVP